MRDFKTDFIWGTATSSYQIEGAAYEDGKGLSIWDVFSGEEDKIFEGHTGEVACDHYHRMKEDVDLLGKLGVKAYRFSISWTRIFPKGIGEVNEKGIQFYSDLVDELLAHGITPYVTLFHWDYPYELELLGGWLNEKSPEWFADYVEVVAKALNGRVKHFFTFNEPQVFLWLGYDKCIHAPGIKYPRRRILSMCRNVALAHGMAVKRLRSVIQDCKVGYAPTCGSAFWPLQETGELIKKTAELQRSIEKDSWLYSSAFWNELIIKGRFHKQCGEWFGSDLPILTREDQILIRQPLDFCGMNLYQGTSVSFDENGTVVLGKLPVGHGKTGMGWSITPKAMYWAVRNFSDTYHIPLIITENGMSALDVISMDGFVHDPGRIDYLARHLNELKRAIVDGAEVEGYFLWSFMDNFEWDKGYDDRFGIVYVDYESQRRIPKDSFYWYQNFIRSNQ